MPHHLTNQGVLPCPIPALHADRTCHGFCLGDHSAKQTAPDIMRMTGRTRCDGIPAFAWQDSHLRRLENQWLQNCKVSSPSSSSQHLLFHIFQQMQWVNAKLALQDAHEKFSLSAS